MPVTLLASARIDYNSTSLKEECLIDCVAKGKLTLLNNLKNEQCRLPSTFTKKPGVSLKSLSNRKPYLFVPNQPTSA